MNIPTPHEICIGVRIHIELQGGRAAFRVPMENMPHTRWSCSRLQLASSVPIFVGEKEGKSGNPNTSTSVEQLEHPRHNTGTLRSPIREFPTQPRCPSLVHLRSSEKLFSLVFVVKMSTGLV
jgi:hypothetical protein